jgi:predicted phosphodiesterase
MRFQYISDIHLEKKTNISLKRHGDVLLLAGDIGDPSTKEYDAFLFDVSSKFDHVVIIAGNHEFYSNNRTIQMTDHMLRSAANKYNNVHFLNNEFFDIPGTDITVYGTTLWTNIDHYDSYMVQCMISDYRCIPGFTIQKNNSLHAEAKHLFRVGMKLGKRYIVLCHHLPKKNLIDPKYANHSVLNAAFASDVQEFDHPSVVAVVYGHTHTPCQRGKYYCNPVGYPGENARLTLDACFSIET